MVVLFLFLTSFFCSKGDKTIQPVLPPTDSGNDNNISEQSDVFYGNPSRDSSDLPQYYSSKIIPIMPVETFDEIENRLRTVIGDGKIQEGQIIFIKAEPTDLEKQNPPLVRFDFAAAENAISPDEISILVDNKDISADFTYSLYYNHIREANFYSGFFELNYYLNPEIPHELKINFHPENGGILEKGFTFNVPQDDRLNLFNAGYIPDESGQDVVRDKIIVGINMPEFLKGRNSLFRINSWEISYADGTLMPLIQEIIMVSPHIFHVKFASDIDLSKIISIRFHPSDGIYSNRFEINGPRGVVDRGGEAYRELAYDNCGDESPCKKDGNDQEYGFTGSEEHDAQDCEQNHWISVTSRCPPRGQCDPRIQARYEKITDYQFENDYENDCGEAPIAVTAFFWPSTSGICGNPTITIDHRLDYEVVLDMIANPPPNPPNDYCKVDSIGPLGVTSDQEPPQIDPVSTCFIKKFDCAPGHCGPNCDDPTCMDCEKWTKYILRVNANDDHCILDNFMFYIYYTDCVEPRTTFFRFFHGIYEDHHIMKEYYVDPNLFACASKMKIIAHDKKGNWSCHWMEKLPANATEFDPKKLPYPVKLNLSFDNRPSDKQYVNLSWMLSDQIDQEICAPHLIKDQNLDYDVNHGPEIFVQVDAIPPFGGIEINLEYIDPPFVFSGKEPTNTWSTPPPAPPPTSCNPSTTNPDTTCSETNNCTGTMGNYYKLWSQHSPYGGDYRTLGDNWNYYIVNHSQIDYYNVPQCDPIRRLDSPSTPCFWNCTAPSTPGVYCTNLRCYGGLIPYSTNINGKFAVYFATMSHGGDNFKFRASGYNPFMMGLTDCVVGGPSQTFTVWRKIYLDYVWMEDRNNQYPSCTVNTSDEYKGVHHINNANFNRIKNIYDDCFIEIEPSPNPYPNSYYQFAVDWYLELLYYGDSTGFRPSPPDHVMLLGVDHVNHVVPDLCGGLLGLSFPYYWFYGTDWEKAYYNYCAVGYIQDIHIPGGSIYLDRIWQSNAQKHILTLSAHELGHCLASKGYFTMDNKKPYGLMNWCGPEYDNRSYFHEEHIIDLRSGLPHFDSNDY